MKATIFKNNQHKEEAPFVQYHSIVRKIWGDSDVILFIFAGAAAEFALNKAVDWLYFTGRLPKDPLGRMFSTVAYARDIVFAPREKAHHTIDSIADIHNKVEESRGAKIPMEAYRDVLYMLIYYSMAAYECLYKQLSLSEKEEVYQVFFEMGERMHLQSLPLNYAEWLLSREEHLQKNLVKSNLSMDLFKQYKKHLGGLRYQMMLTLQSKLVPDKVKLLLRLRSNKFSAFMIAGYKLLKKIRMEVLLKKLFIPSAYISRIESWNIKVR